MEGATAPSTKNNKQQNYQVMKTTYNRNGIELVSVQKDGLQQCTLTSKTRVVDIYREHGGSWTVILSKITKDICGSSKLSTLRVYQNLSRHDAISYFEKKQTEYGFFNN
jgi:hypothetical protein